MVPEHVGDDVLAEIVLGLWILVVGDQVFAQHLPGEDVNPHRGQIALGLLGLFLKFNDAVVRVDVHDAERRGDLPRHGADGDGAVGLGVDVRAEHLVVVHLIDVIARKNQNIVRVVLLDEADVLVDGVCRAAVPLAALGRHVRWQHEHAAVVQVEVPRLAGADVAVEFERPVLRQHADGIDLRIRAV